MSKKQRKMVAVCAVFALSLGIMPVANAMHIMEGYLPAGFCVVWGVLCVPFLVAGFFSIRNKLRKNRRALTILAMSGAFIFVISSLKIPSVTGSCSHMTGRTGRHFIQPLRSEYPGNHCTDFSGNPAGSWRAYHAGSQYVFHGNRRPVSGFRRLSDLPETENKPESRHLPGCCTRRHLYLLCDQRSACHGLSFRIRRCCGFNHKIPGRIRTDPASAGCDRGPSDRDHRHRPGNLRNAGIKIYRIYQRTGGTLI